MSAIPEAASIGEASAGVARRRTWLRALRRPGGLAGVVTLSIFVLIAVLAPYIAPYGERERVGDPFEPPSADHWLGLDDAGVDMVTLLLWGARVSLLVGFTAALVAILIGGTIGLLAGYFGGKTDTILARTADYFLVIPDVPLIIVAAAIWGRSLTNIILIIGIIYWAMIARVTRAQVKSIRERVYIKRSRALGVSAGRIIVHHVLPQVVPLLISLTALTVALAIFLETAISFLGLGDPSLISWGKLIENAFRSNAISARAWWAVVPPGIVVAIVVLACTLIGRSLDEALNPRLRVGHLAVHGFRVRPLPGRDT